VTSSFSKTARLFTGARLRFTRHDALEASYSYSPNHFTVQQSGLPAASAYNRVDLISFNYVRYLWVKSRVQPFVTAGLGINRFSGPSGAVPVAVTTLSGYVNADNGWQFAWNFGGGADLVLQRHFALRLELRDYITGQPKPNSISGITGLAGTSHNIVPSAGIVIRFK
jgi:opacity protein-like surface antigen